MTYILGALIFFAGWFVGWTSALFACDRPQTGETMRSVRTTRWNIHDN
jgi:hypothetical protein